MKLGETHSQWGRVFARALLIASRNQNAMSTFKPEPTQLKCSDGRKGNEEL